MDSVAANSGLQWVKHQVLDDGFVCLVDVMGNDSSVAQAARVSYGAGTKTVNDDYGLIRYLMRHRHTTPFEMCELKFLVRVPMDTWRQWIRHRMASVNEYSTRYSEAIDSHQKTEPGKWRKQSTTNKQGSEDNYIDYSNGYTLTHLEQELHDLAKRTYQIRLDAGVAREQARKDLPLSTYTEAYWKIDLHNLLHFLALRMDSHAQYEIRQYATTIGEKIVKPLFPIVWEAFEDYRLHGMYLTRQDLMAIDAVLGSTDMPDKEDLDLAVEFIQNKRERQEALDKLKTIFKTVIPKAVTSDQPQ